jgi:LuxR family transcriptional regulator, maltose regulon positive regulatory protein
MCSSGGSVIPWVTLPRINPDALDRPRLRQMLDAASSSASVITVTAGAGYGKSTLLAGWARTMPDIPTAWVDGRIAVRAPGGLRQAVRLAVEQVLPELAIAEAGAAASRHGFDWLFAIAASEQPLVLIIDDLQEVHDTAALESLDILLDYLPDASTLVLSSRSDPPLHLSRRCADGRVVELRASDLALDAREITALLGSRGILLDQPQQQRLTAVTRAWPVAVGLAARALTNADDPVEVLDGLASDRRVADYLESEVFAGWDPRWRTVMAAASIVERFCPVLVAELSDVEDADAVLAIVEARTGLLSRSANQPGWWELHPLARAHLGVELAAGGRQRSRALHARAGCWFADQGMLASALEHAIAADDRELLDAIVERIGIDPLLRSTGDGPSIAMLIARTDPSRFTRAGSMAIAVALLATQDPRTAAVLCAPLRVLRPEDPHIERLRAVAIARVERTTAAGGGGWTALLEASHEGASAAELLLLRSEMALSTPPGASLREIRNSVSAELAPAEALGADRVALELRVTLGRLALISGEPRVARRYAYEVLGSERRLGSELARPLVEARLIGMAASLDLGEADVVRWMSRTPSSTLVLAGSVPWTLAAAAIQASMSPPGTGGERARLDRLGRTLEDVQLTRVDRGLLTAVLEVEMRLAGDVQGLHRVERAVARFPACWAGSAEGAYLRARAHQLLRSDVAARRELHPVVHGPLEPAWPELRLRVLALDGMLAHRCGAADADSLGAAVDLGSRTGRLGPFLALGRDMFDALLACRVAMSPHRAFVDELLARMAGSASPPSPAEPLTSAEHTVLRRLDSMATLEEIARGLHVSRNTVKSHTTAIYRKLGVGSRRSALERAQELRLL